MDITATKLATAAATEIGVCMVEIRWAACDTVYCLRELLPVGSCTELTAAPTDRASNRDYNGQMSAGGGIGLLYYNSGAQTESRHFARLVMSVPSRLIMGAICGDPRHECAQRRVVHSARYADDDDGHGTAAGGTRLWRRTIERASPLITQHRSVLLYRQSKTNKYCIHLCLRSEYDIKNYY